MDEATLAKMMEAYAEDAVDHARQHFHLTLDYTDESVKAVEGLLDNLHRDLPRGLKRLFRRPPSEQVIATIAKMYGGYVLGGQLKTGQSWTGQNRPPQAWRPRQWCLSYDIRTAVPR
jgi:hypothetical protein